MLAILTCFVLCGCQAFHIDEILDRAERQLTPAPDSALEILSSSTVEAAELLKFSSSDDAYNWMLDKKRTCSKIYIIDRCDYYKSSESLSAPDRMEAVEVWIWYNDIPRHLHNVLDEFY